MRWSNRNKAPIAGDPRRGRSPHYGGRIGFAIFQWTLRLFGVMPAYVLLAFVVPYYVLVYRSVRVSAAPYLRRRFPDKGPFWRFFATFFFIYRLGQTLVDQGVMGILGPSRFKVEFPRDQELYTRAHAGRGLILLTSHVGNWETAMANMESLDVPVHFQFKIEPHTQGRHFFDLAGKQDQFRIIPPDGFLGGMIEMTNALAKGECVSVMGDRFWGAQTRKAKFLGREALFPIAAYHMAAVTGADLAVLLTAHTGKMAYRIECTFLTDGVDLSRLRREEVIDLLLARYVACLEDYLQRYPFLWFNFFDFWAEDKET